MREISAGKGIRGTDSEPATNIF